MIGAKVFQNGKEGTVIGADEYLHVNFGNGEIKKFSFDTTAAGIFKLTFENPQAEEDYCVLKSKAKVRKILSDAEKKLSDMQKKADEIKSVANMVGGRTWEDTKEANQAIAEHRKAYEKLQDILNQFSESTTSSEANELVSLSQQQESAIKQAYDKVESACQAAKVYANSPVGRHAIAVGNPELIANTGKLRAGQKYGTRIIDIYTQCCNTFGWNPESIQMRGFQPNTWAANSTNEGFDVWFIFNSNYGDGKPSAEGFYNEILTDAIVEHWVAQRDENMKNATDCTRVVFAKSNETAGYLFLGVYHLEVSESDFVFRKRIHRLISATYPFTNIP